MNCQLLCFTLTMWDVKAPLLLNGSSVIPLSFTLTMWDVKLVGKEDTQAALSVLP